MRSKFKAQDTNRKKTFTRRAEAMRAAAARKALIEQTGVTLQDTQAQSTASHNPPTQPVPRITNPVTPNSSESAVLVNDKVVSIIRGREQDDGPDSDMINMYGYKVGQLYHPNRKRWPETVEYNYMQNSHVLKIFASQLTARDIKAISSGPAELGLYVKDEVMLILYRFPGIFAWSDAPYSWHKVLPELRTIPSTPDPDIHALVHIFLVDAATGILLAIRACTISAELTRELHNAIIDQASRPWNAQEYDRTLAGIYRQYQSHQLAAKAVSLSALGA